MLYHGVYRPKVDHLLGQIFLTETQEKKLELASFLKIIAKCGYNRNMHREIRGGPKELNVVDVLPFISRIVATRIHYFVKVLCIAMTWT